jgi:hypothetical protein
VEDGPNPDDILFLPPGEVGLVDHDEDAGSSVVEATEGIEALV